MFFRSCTQFKVPGSDEVLSVAGLRVFATMNPESVGGGRGRLPRSIETKFLKVGLPMFGNNNICGRFVMYFTLLPLTFVQVDLEPPSNGEIIQICADVFRPSVAQSYITSEHVNAILDIHFDLQQAVSSRKLGQSSGGGSAATFNLRDLCKVQALTHALVKDQLQHFELSGPDAQQCHLFAQDAEFVRLSAISKILQLVYSSRFSNPADKEQVHQFIQSGLK